MSVRITNTAMASDSSAHVARLVEGGWALSWLPGRLLSRDQATTGMTIAEIVATEDLSAESRLWPFIDQWAAELGLSGPDAVVRASQPLDEENDR